MFTFIKTHSNNKRENGIVYLLFPEITESKTYHTMIAAKLLIFKKRIRGMHTSRKMKLILLSFHVRFLNLSENIGMSETNNHDEMHTNRMI